MNPHIVWSPSSTTHDRDDEERKFVVTHPYHPLRGKEYTLVTYRYNWGEDRVYFYDHNDQLTSLPARWTSVIAEDPFDKKAQGRAPFRLHDLIKLSQLIEYAQQNNHNSKDHKGADDA